MTFQPLPKILAVDDDVSCAELVVRVAERCGFDGFATSDSRGVMNLASALDPDVISIDICMPNVDAKELLTMMADAKFKGQVLIVSGQSQNVLDETKAYAESLGLTICMAAQKPIDFAKLRMVLSECNGEQAAA